MGVAQVVRGKVVAPEGAVVPKKKMPLGSISEPRIIVAGQIPDVMVGVNEGDSFLVFVPCPAD